jgi:hypothetical protein
VKRASPFLFTALILAALGLIGVGTKLYHGRFEAWIHNYAGGVIYEVFWIVLFGAIFHRIKAWRTALFVFLVTCGLETLQLYHPPLLETIRSTFIGRALIGNGFDPWDFLYYVIGSLIGLAAWGLMRSLWNADRPRPPGQLDDRHRVA